MTDKAKRWWEEEGLVFSGGWHPYTGRMRANIQHEDIEEDYAWEYTEAHVLRLKELGVTLLIGQFDRGLGESDQEEHQELARQLADMCHKHGIHHGCYMANTVYFESMLKDHGDCEDWVIKTHDNRFANYGGQQTFRWVACFNSPGWRNHMKEQIERAINFVKTDELHFDNLGVWPEPDSCHCQYCQTAFRKFLEEKYPTPESQKRRFGFTGFEHFRAPNHYLRFIKPWNLDRIDNPLLQDWIEFRQWTVTDYIRDMSTYAHELKEDICLDSNCQSIFGDNTAFIHGVDQEAQSAHVDIICDENPDVRPDDEPGAIYPSTHRLRGANFYRRIGKPIFSHYRDEEKLGCNLAFNGSVGINAHWGYAEPGKMPLNDHQPGVKELLDHYQRHRKLYIGAKAAAKIAVWRGNKALSLISTDTHLSACVMEQLLFNSQIPFSIVMDGCIENEDLGQFNLIILPDTEFVSDKQVEILTAYVKAGGSLLITEKSGLYTYEPRTRMTPAFAHLFAERFEGSARKNEEAVNQDPNLQFTGKETVGKPAFASFGAGKVAYLPKIDYIHLPHTFKSGYNSHYDGIDSRYWKEPLNSREILDAIDWLDATCRNVRVVAGPELRTELLKTADGEMALTLLRCGDLDGTRDLVLTVRAPQQPANARLYTPQQPKPTELAWSACGDRFEASLTGIARHAMIVMDGQWW